MKHFKQALATMEKIFNAGRVSRWHTHPDLAETGDRLDGHQGRVARIILRLHPSPDMHILAQALTHDDGEHVAGDMSGPAKNQYPNLRLLTEDIEGCARVDLWGFCAMPYKENHRWVNFADKLDAYMWMMHKKPRLRKKAEWQEAKAWLNAEYKALIKG